MVTNLNTTDSKIVRIGSDYDHSWKVVIIRDSHFNGYVRTNFGSQWDYNNLNGVLRAHGGLTYGVDGGGWIGFDCAHAGDSCYYNGEQFGIAVSENTRWDPDGVAEECRALAQQVDALENLLDTFQDRGWGKV